MVRVRDFHCWSQLNQWCDQNASTARFYEKNIFCDLTVMKYQKKFVTLQRNIH